MSKKQLEAYRRLYDRLDRMGFDGDEADTLCRIERTLSRWSEHECNGNIQRDESTGKPLWWTTDPGAFMSGNGWPIPDREKGALRRLASLMAGHPDYVAYHQSDPRGCALYIVAKSDIPEGANLDSCYTRGVAVCI